tara:strand:- start:18 stop:524 length:507 start_codon:yes stop_codon:yes gene_type:complete
MASRIENRNNRGKRTNKKKHVEGAARQELKVLVLLRAPFFMNANSQANKKKSEQQLLEFFGEGPGALDIVRGRVRSLKNGGVNFTFEVKNCPKELLKLVSNGGYWELNYPLGRERQWNCRIVKSKYPYDQKRSIKRVRPFDFSPPAPPSPTKQANDSDRFESSDDDNQ